MLHVHQDVIHFIVYIRRLIDLKWTLSYIVFLCSEQKFSAAHIT